MDHTESSRPDVAGYACAIISVAAALLARLLLNPLLGDRFPFLLFTGAVMVTAWYGGFRPAMAAALLSGLVADFFLVIPRFSFHLQSPEALFGLAAYFATVIGIAALAGSMHAARRKAQAADAISHQRNLDLEKAREQLETRLQERTQELTRANAHLLQSQGEQQASAARLRSYIENAPIGIVIADSQWRFVDANHTALRLVGYRVDELRGQPISIIQLPESEASLARAIDALDETGTVDEIIQFVKRDGTPFWVSFRAAALPAGGRMGFFIDVTVEKRIADQLRIERDWFAKVVSSVPVVICSFRQRPGGTLSFPFANPRLDDIYGVPADSLTEDASGAFARVHPDDIGRFGESVLESARTMTPWRCEYRVMNAKRGELCVDGHAIPVTEPDGSILWHGYFADITVQKRTAQALRTSETRLRLMLEGVSDYAIFMLDPDGRVLTWHKGGEQVYGFSEAEMLGQAYSLLFPAQDIATGKPQLELMHAISAGRCEIEGWRIRRNGSQFWVAGTITTVLADDGKVIGFAKVTRDITAKRRNDELLHSVLDQTIDGIITINDRGTISTINRAGEEIFGYRSVDLIGENVRCLMPEPDRSQHDRYITRYVETDEAKITGIGREVLGLRKDGTSFPMDIAITEFRLDDHRYFVGIVRDISRQKMLEAQLFQSQKMEAFGQLAGGVAHDFNNLLTLINGYSQMLQRLVPENDGKQKMLGQIFRAGTRAASLTQQLLAFSRQQVLDPKVLDINSIVVDTETMLRRLIGEDIGLTTVLNPHLSAVKADPGQIEQVIMNLAVNARDAMPLGGQLTIETTESDLRTPLAGQGSVADPGRYVTISFSDTGTGMPPEVCARVFEPFFTTKGIGKGTGLGLAVAHGIVKQSGGTIDIYSEVGVGTTFKVRLPAINGETIATPVQELAYSTTRSETILLVEDDDNVREFVAITLESFGYSVVTAPDGKTALSLYENRNVPINLVVTDVVMPEMSGRVLAETLATSSPGIKVLYLSGYTDDAVVRHGILQANVAFLQKPFSPDALARKVRDVLDQA